MKQLKKILLSSLFVICYCSVFAQGMQFKLNVKLSQASADAMAFLSYIEAGKGKAIIDSVAFHNGVAVFKGTTLHPQKAVLFTSTKNSGFNPENMRDRMAVYLEQGEIIVSGTSLMATSRVSGTRLNDDSQAFTDMRLEFQKKDADLRKRYNQLSASPNAEASKNLNADLGQFLEEKARAEEAYFYGHLNSPVALEWLKESVNISKEKTKATQMFSKMGSEVKTSFNGKLYAEQLGKMPSAEIGSQAPDFASFSPDGNMISLSSFKGKFVLLDFWASWCVPCRAENPNLVKSFAKYKDKNFTILGYSLDTAKDKWTNAIKKDGLEWPQASDLSAWNGSASKMFGITAIPGNFLIDPHGKIIGRDLMGQELEKALDKVLKM